MDGKVGGLVYHFVPDWNISTMKLQTDIHVLQMIYPTDFRDILTGYLVTLLFFSEMS